MLHNGLLTEELTKYILAVSLLIWVSFLLIYVLGFILLKRVFEKKNLNKKIFDKKSSHKQHLKELKNSLRTNFIFNITAIIIVICYYYDWNLIYSGFSPWSILAFSLSYLTLHHFHDAYFYWTHRAMHEIPWLKKHHATHHHSRIPTPLSALSFSTVEGCVHAFLYLIASFIIPTHWSVMIFFFLFVSWISMWGHSEFEFWPSSLYRLPYGNTFNTITHHNLHHYYNSGNYGLYYRFWDEFCGTLNSQTYPHFYKNKSKVTDDRSMRPDPRDNAGLYFEQLEKFGENTEILIDKVPTFEGIKKLKPSQLNHYPHSYCDGISSLKLLAKRESFNLNFKSKITNKKNESNLLDLFFEFINFLKLFPYKSFSWKKTDSNHDHLISISLSKEQTSHLKQRSKNKKHSLNFEIINLIDQTTSPFIKKRNWLIPVWSSREFDNPQDADMRNNAYFFEFITDGTRDYRYYKKQLHGASFRFWKLSFSFLMFPLKLFFIPLTKVSLWSLKRSGTISNLGSYSSETDKTILFCPPVLSNCPLSIGIIEFNERLNITLKSKARLGPSGDILDEISQNLFKLLTAIN